MTTMYDSVTAADIPASALFVAGYVDGRYAWSAADWNRFPNALRLGISVFGNTADVLDVETGDATPSDAVQWVANARAHGRPYPGVYCNASAWPTVRATFDAHQVAEPWYWIADYDNRRDIPSGAVAKQYINDPASGGHFDLSVISESLITYMTTGGIRMISQADADTIALTILNWDIQTPSHGAGVGRKVWEVLGDGERILTAVSAEQSTLSAAIAAVPAGGVVDVPTLAAALAGPLATALAPALPPETSPAEFFTALAAQWKK
jgi:hypothetical protein